MTRRLAPIFMVLALAPGCKGMGGFASGLGHVAYAATRVAGGAAKVMVKVAPAVIHTAVVTADVANAMPPVVIETAPPDSPPDDAPVPLAPYGDESSSQAAY